MMCCTSPIFRLPSASRFLTRLRSVIATVGIVKEEPAAAPVVEAGRSPTEPEVIGKGKKEDEEGGARQERIDLKVFGPGVFVLRTLLFGVQLE